MTGGRPSTVRIGVAQLNACVGDVEGNTAAFLAAAERLEGDGAAAVVGAELGVCGYPVDDLAGDPSFIDANLAAVGAVAESSGRAARIVGHLDRTDPTHVGDGAARCVANAASVCRSGTVEATHHKRALPDYGPFDETRWFAPGATASVRVPLEATAANGEPVTVVAAVAVCEDLWQPGWAGLFDDVGAFDLVVALNASPWHDGAAVAREAVVAQLARTCGVPVLYVNLVGGADELVFDGGSCLLDATGALVWQAPRFAEAVCCVDVPLGGATPAAHAAPAEVDRDAELWAALTLAVRDYCKKCGIDDVWVGVSGGIDSAVVATIVADALGGGHLRCVSMPGPYTSDASNTDGEALAANLGASWRSVPIADAYSATMRAAGLAEGSVAAENTQARMRAAVLLGLANTHGGIVVCCANKSETAVGYSTLGGDTTGGFAPLVDVPKTRVWDLARWRNRTVPDGSRCPAVAPIPVRSIERAPSAELAEGQVDTDALGEYPLLDAVLERYVELGWDRARISDDGFEAADVERICAMVDRAEFKRRQSPIGPKVTARAFGRDRRMPIAHRWRGAALDRARR